ncbi:primosomal protein N' [Magnetospirillum sulfuroxidans]|uniref:Replication restart protein PriA n=1 Tax=Magnetospirillum sulfuroxidans TaxID=611300 RepID=A0ABS5IF64_9PROT|nr:primosomal protein N' [Magnetospirillum sulfuroxidans]MBR9972378.1 primosomal protein N' [Magnetospirillum sulfuroxidans]
MVSVAANPTRQFSPHSRVAVLLPLPLAGLYDYLAGAHHLHPGDFVVVPLGRREVVGVVWGEGTDAVAAAKLRPVTRRLECPPLPEVSRKFVDWVAGYTLAPPGAVLRMSMSVPAALEPVRDLVACRVAATPPAFKLTEARRRVLAVAAALPPLVAADLAREAGVGPAVIKGLFEAGALEPVPQAPPPPFAHPDPDHPGPVLSVGQRAAADHLCEAVAGGFSVAVIDGVTGSGKTEVYFEAIAAALAAGRQSLILLPEIALSAQWLERFRRRFGTLPAQWHSELSDAKRRDTWRAVAAGTAKVVVGARSALFLPYKELGLVVVDEEHDAGFKQEEGVAYHARDMAVVRGQLGGCPVVLASATPSMETVTNIAAGRYTRLHLPDRHAGALLPEIGLIDLRRHPPPRGFWLSPLLVAAVEETLAAGEQAMLFLNRRGYAPLTLCRKCGHRLQCPHCTAWLVEHRYGHGGEAGGTGRLVCHHCGHHVRPPTACPECGAEDSFAACGPGVERIAEEAAHRFPAARIALMASDTVAGPQAAADLIGKIADHQIDLLIGTQIVAKGYHFPMLTLVGIVDADLGLDGGDLRAGERTHQLLSQVAGRAGRAERPGRVLLQTFQPSHPVMAALAEGDRDAFVATEAEARRAAGMPPFGRLAALIVSGPEAAALDDFTRKLARAAPRLEGFQVIGPAPAPLALLRGRHRRRFLIKARRDVALHAPLRKWLESAPPPHGIRVQVDIDPYGFL